jgi:MFS transporter, MHS family, proline/betaine transporter
MSLTSTLKNTLGGAIGNAIEWYDFAIFGFLAPVTAKIFVSSSMSDASALIYVYALFAIGFISRPIGSFIFGYIGDRYGRATTLRITVWLMSIPTVCIGLMPTYATLGILTPIIIALLRLLQGLAMGGEFTGSIIYLTEAAPQKHRYLFGSFGYISTTSGILIGSAVITLLHHIYSLPSIINYAWRIPFIAAFALTLIAYGLRRRLPEPPKQAKNAHPKNPIKAAFTDHKKSMFAALSLNIFNATGFYTFFIFIVTYFVHYLNMSAVHALTMNTVSLLCLILMMPLSGYLSDIYGSKKILLLASFVLLISLYPIFYYFNAANFVRDYSLLLLLSLLFGLIQGSLPGTFVSLFPPNVRASGLSVSFNISNAIFGGTAPMVAMWLLHMTGNITLLITYLITALLVFMFTLFKVHGINPAKRITN